MSLPAQIVRDLGGTVEEYLPSRPDQTAGVQVQATLLGPQQTEYVAQTNATLDAPNTTLSSAAARGATTLAVASAASIVASRRYLVGTAASEQVEMVRVRSISGTTLTLARPLVHAHASGAAVGSSRVTLVVTAAQASAMFFDGHIRWNWSDDGLTRNRVDYTAVECVRRPLTRLAQVVDLQIREPKLLARLDAEVDIAELLDAAFEDTLERINPRSKVRTIIGSDGLRLPTVYRALQLLAARYGADWQFLRDHYAQEWTFAVDNLRANYPQDADQDGIVERHERAFSSIRVDRA